MKPFFSKKSACWVQLRPVWLCDDMQPFRGSLGSMTAASFLSTSTQTKQHTFSLRKQAIQKVFALTKPSPSLSLDYPSKLTEWVFAGLIYRQSFGSSPISKTKHYVSGCFWYFNVLFFWFWYMQATKVVCMFVQLLSVDHWSGVTVYGVNCRLATHAHAHTFHHYLEHDRGVECASHDQR